MVVVQSLSRLQLFATLRSVAHQAPLSTGFPRQEYWSGLPFPSPGDLPDPGIEPGSPALQKDSSLLSHQTSLKPNEHKGSLRTDSNMTFTSFLHKNAAVTKQDLTLPASS